MNPSAANPIKDAICRQVETMAEDLFAISKRLYENPEIAYEERQACRWLSQFLQKRGFDTEISVGGVETAFTARPREIIDGRTHIAFLAEYDALQRIGHGCGHNLIAAATMGAAVALKKSWPGFDGSFIVVGTPAEEGGGGKARLIDGGVFQGIDMALMMHPGHHHLMGEETLGRIKAKVEFFGRTAHAAAAPEIGRNALDALIGAYNHISAFRQQMAPDGRIHGIITHGGDAPNVIPDYTAGLFYIRAAHRSYLKALFQRFEDCCQAAALAAGCTCTVTIQPPSLEPMKRNAALEQVLADNMRSLGLEITTKAGPSGSTDLGNLSHVMPVIQPFVGICEPEVALHSTQFADATQSKHGREAILAGAKALAMTACDYLGSTKIQQAVSADFDQNAR